MNEKEFWLGIAKGMDCSKCPVKQQRCHEVALPGSNVNMSNVDNFCANLLESSHREIVGGKPNDSTPH